MLYNYFTAKIKPARIAKFSNFHTLLYINGETRRTNDCNRR